jgi:hypothetical protein
MFKKSQNMPVWLSIFAQFAKVDKMQNKVVHLPKKSNKYDLTVGPYFFIGHGPGGLLLLVSHLFAL